MGDNTRISWSDATWNPIRARNLETGDVGWFCVHASEGCRHCYAETMNVQRPFGWGTRLAYKNQNLKHHQIYLHEKTLTQPLRWTRPRMIFVCSMTDLFGEWVPFEMIDKIFAVMALAPQHTFQVLTKRAGRMAEYFEQCVALDLWSKLEGIENAVWSEALGRWPLPNVWVGVSVEDQNNADARIPHLLRCPAAVRWLSAEPLLGSVDLSCITDALHYDFYVNALRHRGSLQAGTLGGIDWVVVGGESGKGARPMHPDWARSLRDQCAQACVAFHFKQWGAWVPGVGNLIPGTAATHEFDDGFWSYRVGKKKAGRALDGCTHDEYPQPVVA